MALTSKNSRNNSNLHRAKKAKNDEFYTRYEDIEAEVMKYRKYFRDKVVYLPCDDPIEKKSEFWSFFVNNFDAFGIKKLIATHYDENGNPDWPALAINYTGKTQFLFRINKNCLDIYDNKTINSLTAERDIPFNQMIYIGDGLTDVPCMRVVKDNHGYSIAVGNDDNSVLEKLISDNRVNFTAKSDYRENSKLDHIIKLILQKIADEKALGELIINK